MTRGALLLVIALIARHIRLIVRQIVHRILPVIQGVVPMSRRYFRVRLGFSCRFP